MKLKSLILSAVAVASFGAVAHAGMPFFPITNPESKYTNSHSTITVSSPTIAVTMIPQSVRFRQITVSNVKNANTDVFYRTDTSTNITIVGDIIKAGTEKTLETGATIWFQVEPGTSPVVIRLFQSTK